MTERSVTHTTFAIERTYNVPPARVFAAFADPKIKVRWFSGPPEWGPAEQELDFRVGGREINRGGPPGGPIHAFEGRYYDIVLISGSSSATTCTWTIPGSRSHWRRWS